jgi:diguanylate cyclase (GGDEF)-like protein
MRAKWHFGPPKIPVRAIVISALALAVPVVAALTAPDLPSRLEPLLWLTALIPGFLLAYYRGWSGVATGLAFAMALFGLVEVYLILTGHRLPDWPFMLSMTGALVLLSLLAGEVSDRLHSDRERAERMALIDPLTGLPNRRFFELTLEREFAAARRGRQLTVAVFDIDGLKQINDRHGHPAGDAAIRAFAEVLLANTRTMNVSARLGGDEFVSILSSATMDGALVFARRVREAAAGIEGLPFQVSVSVGLAQYRADMSRPQALLNAADRALYGGRQDRAAVG